MNNRFKLSAIAVAIFVLSSCGNVVSDGIPKETSVLTYTSDLGLTFQYPNTWEVAENTEDNKQELVRSLRIHGYTSFAINPDKNAIGNEILINVGDNENAPAPSCDSSNNKDCEQILIDNVPFVFTVFKTSQPEDTRLTATGVYGENKIGIRLEAPCRNPFYKSGDSGYSYGCTLEADSDISQRAESVNMAIERQKQIIKSIKFDPDKLSKARITTTALINPLLDTDKGVIKGKVEHGSQFGPTIIYIGNKKLFGISSNGESPLMAYKDGKIFFTVDTPSFFSQPGLRLHVFDLRTGEEKNLGKISVHEFPYGLVGGDDFYGLAEGNIAFTPDNEVIFSRGSNLVVFSARTGRERGLTDNISSWSNFSYDANTDVVTLYSYSAEKNNTIRGFSSVYITKLNLQTGKVVSEENVRNTSSCFEPNEPCSPEEQVKLNNYDAIAYEAFFEQKSPDQCSGQDIGPKAVYDENGKGIREFYVGCVE